MLTREEEESIKKTTEEDNETSLTGSYIHLSRIQGAEQYGQPGRLSNIKRSAEPTLGSTTGGGGEKRIGGHVKFTRILY